LTKSFSCADAGVVCGAKITGETEEEVLQKAVEHAKEKHGVDLTSSQTLARFAQSAIRNEGEPAAEGKAS
jgi:predicted small metal-binding protein